jgi:hypothetical protein
MGDLTGLLSIVRAGVKAGTGQRRIRQMTEFEPGQFVIHPGQPDWGLGQVQTVVGMKVTVNFENVGKVVINTVNIPLEIRD